MSPVTHSMRSEEAERRYSASRGHANSLVSGRRAALVGPNSASVGESCIFLTSNHHMAFESAEGLRARRKPNAVFPPERTQDPALQLQSRPDRAICSSICRLNSLSRPFSAFSSQPLLSGFGGNLSLRLPGCRGDLRRHAQHRYPGGRQKCKCGAMLPCRFARPLYPHYQDAGAIQRNG